jgi:hypothetical protein
MNVNYSKLLLEEVSERLEKDPEGTNAVTRTSLNHIEIKKLLEIEAGSE